MSNPVVVAGRALVSPSTMTYRRHLYVVKQIHDAGLDADAEIDPYHAIDPERTPALLAGFLVPQLPDGAAEPWSVDGAARLAEWFGSLSEAVDHVTLDGLVVEVVAGFFGGRGTSSAISPTSSSPTAPPAAPSDEPSMQSEGTPI